VNVEQWHSFIVRSGNAYLAFVDFFYNDNSHLYTCLHNFHTFVPSQKVLLCPICGMEASSERQLSAHLSRAHLAVSPILSKVGEQTRCLACSKCYHQRYRLIQHIQHTKCKAFYMSSVPNIDSSITGPLNTHDNRIKYEASKCGSTASDGAKPIVVPLGPCPVCERVC
jgi:hypothetical protein